MELIDLNNALIHKLTNCCKEVAGSSKIVAACVSQNTFVNPRFFEPTLDLLLLLRNFRPLIKTKFLVEENNNILLWIVDSSIFEKDVQYGIMGETLSEKITFSYFPLINKQYLSVQDLTLKKRLIIELTQKLILEFPKISNDLFIKSDFFLYATMSSRARFFPPLTLSFRRWIQESTDSTRIVVQDSFIRALKQLAKQKCFSFSNGYVKLSSPFIDQIKNRKILFQNLFKTAQKTLFLSLLTIYSHVMSLLYSKKSSFTTKSNLGAYLNNSFKVNPEKFLFYPSAQGLIPLDSSVGIDTFVNNILSIPSSKIAIEPIGGFLSDIYSVRAITTNSEKKFVVKKFREWSMFKWFPLSLWAFGTARFTVSARKRLENELSINRLLRTKGFSIPKILHVNYADRMVFMEFVDGQNLVEIIRILIKHNSTDKFLSSKNLFFKIGEIFATFHRINIAIGDSKPSNIIVKNNEEIIFLDFEQASEKGDKAWDLAEFLYYLGHYLSPMQGIQQAKFFSKHFIYGYLKNGGSIELIRKAGNPKYAKVFSVFLFPHILITISKMLKQTKLSPTSNTSSNFPFD